MTGTGAFLLLAAAAVFTAVRWGDIPDAVKLGALGLATGGVPDRRSQPQGRPSRPPPARCSTSAPSSCRSTWPPSASTPTSTGRTLLLAEGLVATVTFGWAAITERSVVLRWAFAVAVVALAGGIGATTALPAPLVLAGFAAAALAWRLDGLATGWAALAGVAPLLTFVDRARLHRRRHLRAPRPHRRAAPAGRRAHRRRPRPSCSPSPVAAATTPASCWSASPSAPSARSPPGPASDLERQPTPSSGLAAAFLLVELVAYATPRRRLLERARRHRRPRRRVVRRPRHRSPPSSRSSSPRPPTTTSTRAGPRRRSCSAPAGWWPTVGAAPAASCSPRSPPRSASASAVASRRPLATPSSPSRSTALAGLAVLSDHRAGSTVAVARRLAGRRSSPSTRPAPSSAVGVAGTLVLAEAAVRRSTRPRRRRARRRRRRAVGLGAVGRRPGPGRPSPWACSSARRASVVAGLDRRRGDSRPPPRSSLDRGRVTGTLPLGTLARIGARRRAGRARPSCPPREVAVVALAVGGPLDRSTPCASATRTSPSAPRWPCPSPSERWPARPSCPSPPPAWRSSISAAVLVGLGSLLDRRWSLPILAARRRGLRSAGLALAAHDASAFADAVMITSGIGLAVVGRAGPPRRRPPRRRWR